MLTSLLRQEHFVVLLAFPSNYQIFIHMRHLLTIVLLVLTSSLFAQNCLTGWTYYRPVSVNNPSADALSDFQTSFVLNTGELVSAGKLAANGADLRITDAACNVLPYFMDSLATDTVNVIWVRVPAISATDTLELQLYYGNPVADSVANGDSTFIFFDDFAADTVNPAKWEAVGGYTTFEPIEGILNYSSNGMNPGPRFKFARTAMQFTDAVHFDFQARISNSNGIGFSSGDSTIQRIIFRQSSFGFDTLNQVAMMLDTVSNGIQVEGLYPLIRFPRNQLTAGSIRAGIQDTFLTLNHFANLTDNSSTDSTYQLTQIKMNSFHFIVSSFLGSQTIFLDYLRVRKPIPDTVNVSVGMEEMLIASSLEEETFSLQLILSPNPASHQVHIEGLPTGAFQTSLINVQGQVINQQKLASVSGQDAILAIPNIPAGLYWISIQDRSQQVFSQSILIQQE